MTIIPKKEPKLPIPFCLQSLRSRDTTLSRPHRWAIYIIGLLETLTFGGCIFGWSQLVYVLKNEEVFLDSCSSFNEMNLSNSSILLKKVAIQDVKVNGCPEQDRIYSLIYIIAATLYSGSSFFYGMILYHYGLVVSRLASSTMVILGFVALAFTDKEHTLELYLAMILLALGGSGLRLSGLQFCNLFPKYRSTALTIISGSYASSAGSFLVFYIGQQNGLSVWIISIALAGCAFASLFATVIMPWHSIISENVEQSPATPLPLQKSVLTISTCCILFWLTFNIIGLQFYAVFFNSWTTSVSKSNEEAGYFSILYSGISFGSFFVTPFPGLLTDFLLRRAAKAPTPEEKLLRELQSPALSLLLVTFMSASLIGCYFFKNSLSIYISLVIFTFLRPSILSACNTFVRIRYPAEHFDRMIGIIGTLLGILSMIVYPLFVWSQKSFIMAMTVFIGATLLTVLHPLHLFINRYMKRVVEDRISSTSN